MARHPDIAQILIFPFPLGEWRRRSLCCLPIPRSDCLATSGMIGLAIMPHVAKRYDWPLFDMPTSMFRS